MKQKCSPPVIKAYSDSYFNQKFLPQLAIHVVGLSSTSTLVGICSAMKLYDQVKSTKQDIFISEHLAASAHGNHGGSWERIQFQLFNLFKSRFDDLNALIKEAQKQSKASILLYNLAKCCVHRFAPILVQISRFVDTGDEYWRQLFNQHELQAGIQASKKSYRMNTVRTEPNNKKVYFNLGAYRKQLKQKIMEIKKAYTEICKRMISESSAQPEQIIPTDIETVKQSERSLDYKSVKLLLKTPSALKASSRHLISNQLTSIRASISKMSQSRRDSTTSIVNGSRSGIKKKTRFNSKFNEPADSNASASRKKARMAPSTRRPKQHSFPANNRAAKQSSIKSFGSHKSIKNRFGISRSLCAKTMKFEGSLYPIHTEKALGLPLDQNDLDELANIRSKKARKVRKNVYESFPSEQSIESVKKYRKNTKIHRAVLQRGKQNAKAKDSKANKDTRRRSSIRFKPQASTTRRRIGHIVTSKPKDVYDDSKQPPHQRASKAQTHEQHNKNQSLTNGGKAILIRRILLANSELKDLTRNTTDRKNTFRYQFSKANPALVVSSADRDNITKDYVSIKDGEIPAAFTSAIDEQDQLTLHNGHMNMPMSFGLKLNRSGQQSRDMNKSLTNINRRLFTEESEKLTLSRTLMRVMSRLRQKQVK